MSGALEAYGLGLGGVMPAAGAGAPAWGEAPPGTRTMPWQVVHLACWPASEGGATICARQSGQLKGIPCEACEFAEAPPWRVVGDGVGGGVGAGRVALGTTMMAEQVVHRACLPA